MISWWDKEAGATPRGFTFMEAMMTLAVLAVLVSLALPNISGGLRASRMRSATIEIMHLVDFARVQAQSRNRAYEFVLDTSNHTITINESSNAKCTGMATGLAAVRTLTLNASHTDFDGIKVVALTPNSFDSAPSLCFKPDGRVLLTNTRKPVASSDAAYGAGDAVIVVQRTGAHASPRHAIVIPYNGIPSFRSGG